MRRGTKSPIPSHIGNRNPFRYRSYYYDTETGLYYLKARYYDPEVGRFISADDLAYVDPDHVNGLNLYAYCNNNPVMYADPYGREAIALSFLAFALLALICLALIVYIEIQFHPLQNTFEAVGQGLVWLGTQAYDGIQWLLEDHKKTWEPGTWPGDDPTVAPGDDFFWRGPGEVGSDHGEWFNPITADQLHPDFFHGPPKGPHWDWRNKLKKILHEDIFKNGGPPTLA